MLQHVIFWAFAILSSVASAQQNPPYAFRDANEITLNAEEALQGQTVLVADGRIAAMGPEDSVAVSSDAVVIEASGRGMQAY